MQSATAGEGYQNVLEQVKNDEKVWEMWTTPKASASPNLREKSKAVSTDGVCSSVSDKVLD